MVSSKEKLIELIEFGNEIKEIINLWDPMGLIDFCPADEYETEIKGIRNLVVNNRNIDKKLWDPLKIIDISFYNEYSYEINRIIEELSKNISAQDLAKKINKILKNTYNELYEIEKNEEIKIARKILKAYNIEEGTGI